MATAPGSRIQCRRLIRLRHKRPSIGVVAFAAIQEYDRSNEYAGWLASSTIAIAAVSVMAALVIRRLGYSIMHRLLTICALIALFPLAPTTSYAADEAFQAAVTGQLTDLTKGETSGVAVLVARDGKIAFQGGFGLADISKKTPITPETKFRIGSVSKQFTAAAILRLVEQGKLSLDDKLAKYFLDFSHRPDVTLRHLLTHTSGIPSYTDDPTFFRLEASSITW